MIPPRERKAARLVYTKAMAQYGEGTNEVAAAWQACMKAVCPDVAEAEAVTAEEAEL